MTGAARRPWRVLVVGYGVQGRKRQGIAGPDCAGIVDPIAAEADWRQLDQVPADIYDAALVCTPDGPKPDLVEALLVAGKHVLVEKPFAIGAAGRRERLARLAAAGRLACYTAYNHRFEPHLDAFGRLIAEGTLGRLHHLRLFYGNGTARLVRDSAWRDQGQGVLADLGSHLLDLVRGWFGDSHGFRLASLARHENRAPDRVLVLGDGDPAIELSMSLLSWKNEFAADLYGDAGSAHVEGLCKWGPSSLTHRRRVLPAGRPPEETRTLVRDDPTWALEYAHFKQLCQAGGDGGAALAGDAWIQSRLDALWAEALR